MPSRGTPGRSVRGATGPGREAGRPRRSDSALTRGSAVSEPEPNRGPLDAELEPEALRALASLAGLAISDEEVPRLAAGAAHLWTAANRLREVDLEAYREIPGTRFDPRWR